MEELLCALRAPGDTPVPVPSWHYEEDEPRQADTMLLRDALTLCYDLRRALLLGQCWTCTFIHAGPLDRWQPHCMVLSDLFLWLKERSLHAGSRCPKPELLQVLLDGLQREAAPAQAAKAQANGHVIHANGSAFGDTGEQPSAATRVWCSPLCVGIGPFLDIMSVLCRLNPFLMECMLGLDMIAAWSRRSSSGASSKQGQLPWRRTWSPGMW